MGRFLHTVAVQDQLISADGIQSFPLGPNPLSCLLVALRPLNDTGTLTNFASYRQICTAINRLTLSYRGESIVSGRGEDLAALAYFRHGIIPYQGQHDQTDDERRCVVLPIMLGRHPYNSKCCLPASHRGELQLEMDFDIADTGYDGLRISVEAIELLDAKPTEFERTVTYAQTFGATGPNDVQMAAGNPCRGILVFGTTGFAGATPAPSWGRMKVLLDNEEAGYAATDFEVAQSLHSLWGRQPPTYDFHIHNFEPVAGIVTIGPPFNVGGTSASVQTFDRYAYLDLDPTKDDEFTLPTRGKSSFAIRGDAETADAVRAIPIEVVKL